VYSSSQDCSTSQEEYSIKIECVAIVVIHRNGKQVAIDAAVDIAIAAIVAAAIAVVDKVSFFHGNAEVCVVVV
jgi:chemotaxis methyl-accepting protein methylase